MLVRKNHDLLRVVGLVRCSLIQLQNIKINSSGPFNKTKIEENHIVPFVQDLTDFTDSIFLFVFNP